MPYIFSGKYVPPYLRNNPIVPKRVVTAVTGEKKLPNGRETAVETMRVNKQNYERRSGKITNHQVISEYSVTLDRQVLNDRSNAKYLVEENVRDGVYFDLVEGLDSFVDKALLPNDLLFHPRYKWAITQPGATIKEVFHGADFACSKGTLRKIAMTLSHTEDAWTVVAQNFDGVIFLSSHTERCFFGLNNLSTYTKCSFKQYMTTDKPNGLPDTKSPVDNRTSFEMMVRTDLVDGEKMIKLCCGGTISALRGGSEPIEFSTIWDGLSKAYRGLPTVILSELMDVKTLVTGIKRGAHRTQEVVVHKVFEKKVSEIKSEKNVSEDLEQIYSFLFDVLSKLKKLIEGREACVVSFDHFGKKVVFKSISRKEAKEMGHEVPDDFLTHFNIQQGEVTEQPEMKEEIVERMDAHCSRKSGALTNHQIISEYSVTIDHEIKNDRSHAKYLVEENIRGGVSFDLAEGLESFNHRGEYFQEEYPFCKWAITQPGATIKEVFGGADFACWRGSLKRIAMTVVSNTRSTQYNPKSAKFAWKMVAQNFDGVILLGEQRKLFDGNRFSLKKYSGFKFMQYMTADEPNGRPDTDSPVDNRATFEMMVRTDLMDGRNVIKLCCGTEIGALKRGQEGFEPIEFKTVWEEKGSPSSRDTVTAIGVMQSELVGVKSVVTGMKRGDVIFSKNVVVVHKVVEKKVSEMKADRKIADAVGHGYSFLFDVLTRLKKFIEDKEACEMSYDPFAGKVVFKSISRQEAKEIGNGVTDEFLARFNIHQERKSASDLELSSKTM